MNLDFNAITAIATSIAAFIAIYAIWVENKRSRFTHSVDLLFRMSDLFFYNKDFINNRKKAAQYLKNKLIRSKSSGKRKIDKAKSENLGEVELDELLDFFEALGTLVYKKAIDEELAYNYFSWWLECYYVLAKQYLATGRAKDANYWSGVQWLYERFYIIKYEAKSFDVDKLSSDDLKGFIEREISLK